jgi:hypothetical protein
MTEERLTPVKGSRFDVFLSYNSKERVIGLSPTLFKDDSPLLCGMGVTVGASFSGGDGVDPAGQKRARSSLHLFDGSPGGHAMRPSSEVVQCVGLNLDALDAFFDPFGILMRSDLRSV